MEADDKGFKATLTIENNSDEYCIFDLQNFVVEVKGSTYHPDEKDVLIKPHDKTSVNISIKGNAFRSDVISIQINKFGKAKTTVDGTNAVYDISKFTIENKGMDRKIEKDSTYKVVAHLNVTYNGDDLGFYDKGGIKLVTPIGNKISSNKEDAKQELLKPKKSDSFTISFSNIDRSNGELLNGELKLLYDNCFIESKIRMLDSKTLLISLNQALTKEKR